MWRILSLNFFGEPLFMMGIFKKIKNNFVFKNI